YLVENLPEVSFHIAAKTNVSDRLECFKKYDNVTLYTNVHHDDIIEDLLDQSEIYLDINHWDQVDSIVDRAFEKGKPVFAFDNVVHRAELGASVFSHQDPEMMVKAIQRQLFGIAVDTVN
ncbi:MAG: exopolysaccharide biosynthesis protein, partial [Streptococcus salivarius]|nr:exopolysaccharide biosynthesis protein [Streptococcus salivarius]